MPPIQLGTETHHKVEMWLPCHKVQMRGNSPAIPPFPIQTNSLSFGDWSVRFKSMTLLVWTWWLSKQRFFFRSLWKLHLIYALKQLTPMCALLFHRRRDGLLRIWEAHYYLHGSWFIGASVDLSVLMFGTSTSLVRRTVFPFAVFGLSLIVWV